MPDPDSPTVVESSALMFRDVGGPIETVLDAIREDAVLAAIGEVVKQRRAALKRLVGTNRPGWKQESELGTALVTKPSRRATVVDDDAFLAWAIEAHPDRIGHTERIDTTPVSDALDGRFDDPDDDTPLSQRLGDLIDEIPGARTVHTIVDAKLADEVSDPAVALEREDGTVVDRDTGEVIPGLKVAAASSPSPRITPDKTIVADLTEEILSRLEPIGDPDTQES